MKQRKKVLTILCTAVLVLGCLAGCGSKDDGLKKASEWYKEAGLKRLDEIAEGAKIEEDSEAGVVDLKDGTSALVNAGMHFSFKSEEEAQKGVEDYAAYLTGEGFKNEEKENIFQKDNCKVTLIGDSVVISAILTYEVGE